ncbi:uncharacterized protein DUF937 [Rahnella sp. BIGb0236]|uniref:YidB family protein n=1 Tax=Rahnella sp. BIGb0236 TaxID=2485117 RepID=UPI0010622250|nr:YidB family protein [Rahnella sp. BIGb0236]TDS84860.1 uncharacterized protein DUF937 [Rahnella sp. BIGb0236]
MSLIQNILGSLGLSDQISDEFKGVVEWVEQQGGIHSIVNRLQNGEFSDIVKSWLSDDKNRAISSELVQKMLNTSEINQLADHLGINFNDASKLLAECLPQLVNMASSNGNMNENTDLIDDLSKIYY